MFVTLKLVRMLVGVWVGRRGPRNVLCWPLGDGKEGRKERRPVSPGWGGVSGAPEEREWGQMTVKEDQILGAECQVGN